MLLYKVIISIYIYIYIELEFLEEAQALGTKEEIKQGVSTIKSMSIRYFLLDASPKLKIVEIYGKLIKRSKDLSSLEDKMSEEMAVQSLEIANSIMENMKSTTIGISSEGPQGIKSIIDSVHDIAASVRKSVLPGDFLNIQTQFLEINVGREYSSNLIGKPLLTRSNQMIQFPIKLFEGSEEDYSFEMFEYLISPHMGEVNIVNDELGPQLELNLFSGNSDSHYTPTNLTQPFQLVLRSNVIADNYNCSYFDISRNTYSTVGLQLVSKEINLSQSITGTFKCTSTHLSIFGVAGNPYTEIGGLIMNGNYDTMNDVDSLEDYDWRTSKRINIYIYIYKDITI